MKLVLLLLLAVYCERAQSARILAVFPVVAPSHHNMFRAILGTLASRGHEVVSYTALPQPKSVHPNVTEILLDKVPKIDQSLTMEMLSMLMKTQVAASKIMWSGHFKIVEGALESECLQKLIKSKQHFDLIILESQFAQEALLGLGHIFKAPVISLQPFGSFSAINKLTGNSLSLASVPDYSLPLTTKMSFYERALNSFSILASLVIFYQNNLPHQERVAKEFYKDPTMPSVYEMAHNVSLYINNAHPTVHYAQPTTPNIVSVGGIHLAEKLKPLPADIKKFMDESDGVVYFCLGSFVPDHQLPQSYFDNFINVFGKLKQRVIWKTNYDRGNLPDNVMTLKWAPQQEILAHPKMELFITHGGLFGQHEAIHAGVPVVCIPFFGDQPMNARFYEEKGVGVQLLFDSLTEKTIGEAVTTVLGNKKYRENMKRLSLIYRDSPLSPADSLVFWVEYVLRHRGAPHLRPQSSKLSWYQLALLDVAAALLLISSPIIIAVFIILRKLIRLVCCPSAKSVSASKKTN